MGAQHRAKFLLESVEDLRQTLSKQGTDLIIRHQSPVDAVKDLISRCNSRAPVSAIVMQQEITDEEQKVEASIQRVADDKNIKFHSFWGLTLYHKSDIPFRISEIPDTYTQFRKSVEMQSKIRDPVTMPEKLRSLPPIELDHGQVPTMAVLGVIENSRSPPSNAFPFPGGESAALDRLQRYLWGSDAIATYKETRNRLLGEDYSTKFGAWLALGCLSPRQIHAEIRCYETERVANQSTYWVLFELIWRDYFKFVCLRYGDAVLDILTLIRSSWLQNGKFKHWRRPAHQNIDALVIERTKTLWKPHRNSTVKSERDTYLIFLQTVTTLNFLERLRQIWS